ncbi:hypothetical protein Tco_0648810 [Tanacetum coccineum]
MDKKIKIRILEQCDVGISYKIGHSSTNDVNTANVHVSTGSIPVSTASTNNSTVSLSNATVYAYLATQPNGSQVVHEDLEQIHEDDLNEMDLKWQLALLSMKAKKFYQRTGKNIIINGSDTAGYDKKKDSSRRTVNVEESSSKAMLAIDGTGFDWSYMAQEEASTNFALMAFFDPEIAVLKRDASFNESDINGLKKQVERLKKEKEDNQFKINNFENASKSLLAPPSIDLSNSELEKFKQPEFKGYGVKVNKGASENVSKEVKKTSDAPIIEDLVFYCDEDKTVVLESLNVQKPKQADQLRKVSQNPRNNSTNWNTPMPKNWELDFSLPQKLVLKRMTSVVGEQGINAIKSTTYWAWRPKIKMINHVSKNTVSCISLAIPEQMATGKESSNPFMAGSLPKTIRFKSTLQLSSRDGTLIQINMLVDKKYPLKEEILKKMINLKIEAEEESDMASELKKFKQISDCRRVKCDFFSKRV